MYGTDLEDTASNSPQEAIGRGALARAGPGWSCCRGHRGCTWDPSPGPGGREHEDKFMSQEHMGMHNMRSQEKSHVTGLVTMVPGLF